MNQLNRRDWLKAASAAPAALWLSSAAVDAAEPGRRKLPVAAVVTHYVNNSHADVLIGKILEGWEQQGGAGPDLQLVSMYADQVPANDFSRQMAAKYGVRVAKTIDEAVTLGTDEVQVAGVISVGEHGDYPYTEDTKQHMYPRRRFFDEIAAAFRRCGQVVPVFSDKHLSYRWSDAKHMYDVAREMKIPFMAGSSLPVAWRVPPIQLPSDCQIEAALAVGYGGLESYGFHALETLQCMVERRRGGETGVAAVQAVQGDAVWKAEQDGRWSRRLLQAALATMPDVADGPLEKKLNDNSAFYLIEYRDGLNACVAMANGVARQFGCAVKLKGQAEPVATWFKLQEDKPYGHFAYLLNAIDHMVHTGEPAYPVERTLLTTGVLDAAMHSLADDGKRLATAPLDIRYQAADWPFANHPRSKQLVKFE